MPLWRCPHCATPQPESSRCWLCRRSTTTCAACRHYRKGVAGGLGLCGKSARRLALRGTEVRPCWEAVVAADDGPSVRELAGLSPRGRSEADERPHRTFVPVDELRAAAGRGRPASGPVAPGDVSATRGERRAVAPEPAGGGSISGRWSLWGDLEA